MQEKMKLDINNVIKFIGKNKLDSTLKKAQKLDRVIKQGTGPGSGFLGWMHLGSATDSKIVSEINAVADEIKKKKSSLLCIGIGGSYLGSKAGIEFLSQEYPGKNKEKGSNVYFAGNNLNSDYLQSVLGRINDNKNIYINVISKSGTTIEPALGFRIIYNFFKKKYNKNEIRKRIVCTTDKQKGTLKNMADREGFRTFTIPDNVGGRFSVLTPVGLFPMACAGIDIKKVLKGASDFEKYTYSTDAEKNIAYIYAAIRNLLYLSGKNIEILSGFHPSIHFFLEWWKQLFAESEGKDSKGIFPATADFTTDLHSIGQLIQQGERNIFETFLLIKKTQTKTDIPCLKTDIDKLNYLCGKDISYVEKGAYKGTAKAHSAGGVPNMTITIPERSAYCLGQMFYFFEIAVAMSGYMLGINPFDQPGVEAYKNNMYKLLKRPKL